MVCKYSHMLLLWISYEQYPALHFPTYKTLNLIFFFFLEMHTKRRAVISRLCVGNNNQIFCVHVLIFVCGFCLTLYKTVPWNVKLIQIVVTACGVRLDCCCKTDSAKPFASYCWVPYLKQMVCLEYCIFCSVDRVYFEVMSKRFTCISTYIFFHIPLHVKTQCIHVCQC